MKTERIRNAAIKSRITSLDPPTVEIKGNTPTVENDPTEGIRGVQWKCGVSLCLTPTVEICINRISRDKEI